MTNKEDLEHGVEVLIYRTVRGLLGHQVLVQDLWHHRNGRRAQGCLFRCRDERRNAVSIRLFTMIWWGTKAARKSFG